MRACFLAFFALSDYDVGFECDVDLAVRYEANAAEYLEAEDVHDLAEVEDFLDNTKSVRKQIQLANCAQLAAEFKKSSKWLQKYGKYFAAGESGDPTRTEPSLHVAKALLELSDELEIQPKEVFKKCQIIFSVENSFHRKFLPSNISVVENFCRGIH